MLHTLTRSLRENKGPALVTVLLSALEVVFEIVIPLFMSNLIDFGIEGGSMAAVWKFGAFLLLLAAFQLATGVLAARIAARASVGFAANLREDMYNNVQTFAFSNIDKFSTASIITRLTTDTTNVQNAFQMLMRMAIRAPVWWSVTVLLALTAARDMPRYLPAQAAFTCSTIPMPMATSIRKHRMLVPASATKCSSSWSAPQPIL